MAIRILQPRKTKNDVSRPRPVLQSHGVAAAAWAVLLFLLTLSSGCGHWSTQTAAHDVWVEVFDRQAKVRLTEWVVESELQSQMHWAWSEEGADRTFETTLRLVAVQSPSQDGYHVDAFTNLSVTVLPPSPYAILCAVSTSEARRVYAVGYEIGDPGTQVRSNGGNQSQPNLDTAYGLSPWSNKRTDPAVIEVLRMLEDKDHFRPYEALRGTPQGTGVPVLYQYYIERYEAIVKADPEVRDKRGVKATIAWLRERAK